jgi:tetratricopeptide (TPR) repeat protein
MTKTTLALLATAALAAASAGADVTPQAAGGAGAVERAAVWAARADWDRAVAAYREAIAASPDDASLHNRLGICYQTKGDAKAARKAYRKALALRKDYAEAWNNLGTIDHARGKYKQAIAAYGKAIQLDPKDAVFHKNLGAAWLARGDADKALEAWGEAYRLDPGALESKGVSVAAGSTDLARQYYLYAKLHAARGDQDGALEYLVKALALGFHDFQRIERDRDFASLVADPRYVALK